MRDDDVHKGLPLINTILEHFHEQSKMFRAKPCQCGGTPLCSSPYRFLITSSDRAHGVLHSRSGAAEAFSLSEAVSLQLLRPIKGHD